MDKDPQSSNFFDLGDDPYANSPRGSNPEQNFPDETPEASPAFVAELQLANSEFNINPSVIYVPCSGMGISPSEAFPGAEVIYLDKNSYAVEALKKAGYNAVEEDALKFVPTEQVDLVILENPQISPEFMARTVKESGYIICNNYSDTATKMYKLSDFELLGMIRHASDNQAMDLTKEGVGEYLGNVKESAFNDDIGQFVFRKKSTDGK